MIKAVILLLEIEQTRIFLINHAYHGEIQIIDLSKSINDKAGILLLEIVQTRTFSIKLADPW